MLCPYKKYYTNVIITMICSNYFLLFMKFRYYVHFTNNIVLINKLIEIIKMYFYGINFEMYTSLTSIVHTALDKNMIYLFHNHCNT